MAHLAPPRRDGLHGVQGALPQCAHQPIEQAHQRVHWAQDHRRRAAEAGVQLAAGDAQPLQHVLARLDGLAVGNGRRQREAGKSL